ncbi:MAG TPA: alpha/beta hydrolase [Pyrinomonadaceae bacterium]|nr:alpha/beta hydrolase [Pyrinomonadaceae bacterium]
MKNNQQLLPTVSKIVLLLAFILIAPISAIAQVWTVVGFDAKGDGRDPSLADAATLSFRYDKQQDFLWFRVSLYGQPNEQAFGVNLAFDTGGDEAAKMNWWGANKAFKFDKLVTAWVTRGTHDYEGTIGIGDARGVKTKQFNNLLQNNLQLRVEGDAIIIGVKRTDITDKQKLNLIAAVGSNEQWNDDVPNAGSIAIDLSAERPKTGLREIDVSLNNLKLPADYRTLGDDKPPLITKKGQGRQALILVPGLYSGASSFDAFIARNQSRYKFYVVTPPGINGTPARSMPDERSSFGEMTWTRRLERDILALIDKEKLSKPIVITEREPGSQAAIELAIAHPDKIGGVVLAATNLTQFFASPKDPTRKTPATLQERISLVDEGWVAKWFKYVTPETWNSNDMRPETLSADASRGRKASQEIEAAPLAVKIRYLCEFWASDVARDFDKLQVPVLALVPGFDEKFLADPTNAFTKMAYVNSWETLTSKNPKVKLMRIPDARLLILEDQPRVADDAIATFVEQMAPARAGVSD